MVSVTYLSSVAGCVCVGMRVWGGGVDVCVISYSPLKRSWGCVSPSSAVTRASLDSSRSRSRNDNDNDCFWMGAEDCVLGPAPALALALEEPLLLLLLLLLLPPLFKSVIVSVSVLVHKASPCLPRNSSVMW